MTGFLSLREIEDNLNKMEDFEEKLGKQLFEFFKKCASKCNSRSLTHKENKAKHIYSQ